MASGAAQVDRYLDTTAAFSAEPSALFSVGDDFARQFLQLARVANDYTADGMLKARGNIFAAVAAALKPRAASLAKVCVKAYKDFPLMRDPGKELLLAKARPDILSIASTVAIAPVRYGLEVLRQSLPADPTDDGDRALIESVAAVLWMRRTEWGADPALAESVVAQWRRMVARYRDASFYSAFYVRLRLARALTAWLAATNSLLQSGQLDPVYRAPLQLAFGPPDDPVALVEQALPATDAQDTLTAYGLRAADGTGRVGGSRSSEGVAPIRLPDRGSRPT